MVEDCKRFLNKIKKLKPYLVKFNKDNTMKSKIYRLDYIVEDEDCRSIMIITYNKYIFLANDSIFKAEIRVEDTFLYSNSQRQDIMISKFLLLFSHLNFFYYLNKNDKR